MTNFRKTSGGIAKNEYDTFITTYEGIKVPVTISQIYYQAVNVSTGMHSLISKNVFTIKQPLLQRKLNNVERIEKNSLRYSQENDFKYKNKEYFEIVNRQQDEFLTKRCGFKMMPPENE